MYDQQMQQPSPFLVPNTQSNGNMVLMTNPEDEILKLEANFRGQVLSSDGNYVNAFQPRMNEQGINEIVGLVRSIVNRVTFMSNIDEKTLYSFMEQLAETVVQLLMVNKERFSIRSDAQRTAIFTQSMNVAHIAALRGFQEGDKRFWKGTVQEINYGMTGQDNRGKVGMLDKLGPKSWG